MPKCQTVAGQGYRRVGKMSEGSFVGRLGEKMTGMKGRLKRKNG